MKLSKKLYLYGNTKTIKPYFRTNFFDMETQKRSKGLYWILFFASVAAFFLLYAFKGEMLTLSLPFVVTFFALAMDIM